MGNIYAGSDRFRPVGRVDAQGKVYAGDAFHPVGRIDTQGRVFVTEQGRETEVGRVDAQGRVYAGNQLLGSVNANGVVSIEGTFGPVASVDPPHRMFSGAAYLLVLR